MEIPINLFTSDLKKRIFVSGDVFKIVIDGCKYECIMRINYTSLKDYGGSGAVHSLSFEISKVSKSWYKWYDWHEDITILSCWEYSTFSSMIAERGIKFNEALNRYYLGSKAGQTIIEKIVKEHCLSFNKSI